MKPHQGRNYNVIKKLPHILLFLAFIFTIVCLFLYFHLTQSIESNDASHHSVKENSHRDELEDHNGVKNKLAVIVPFRDRFDELLRFVPHMDNFLKRQNIDFSINIINQASGLRFNRASLVNAGFTLVTQDDESVDYIVIHDVDLLPLTHELSYRYPGLGTPMHLSSPQLHPKYNYSTYAGGILLITTNDFIFINGMSNRYWGWGLEDDEFRLRMSLAGFILKVPENISTGRDGTFLHIHGQNRKRDTSNLHDQKASTRRLDRQTGLSNVNFTLVKKQMIHIDSSAATVYTVDLHCDRTKTPWCDYPEKKKKTTPSKS